MTLNDKFTRLKESLGLMERVIIAYSGGVDSTLLLKASSISGLKKILAVTADSESFPRDELFFAKKTASDLNIKHRIIKTEELKDKNYASNPPDRCYYCKKELFGKLRDIAVKEGFPFILDGTNADDIKDWRPGTRAALETDVHSPLLEAGLGKQEIRDISRTLKLPSWDKPSTPCLSSRFPYGQNITSQALLRVNRAEDFIKKFGVKQLRVRDHAETARIEILPEDFHLLMDETRRKEIVSFLKSLGYKYISLDLHGFRSGSLNEFLPKDSRGQAPMLSCESRKGGRDSNERNKD